MRTLTLSLSIPIALAVLACSTEPNRVQRAISAIQVPAHAAAGDTIQIKFQVDASPCNTGLIVDSQLMNDRVRISASTDPDSQIPCPAAGAAAELSIPRTFVYVVVPFHSVPFTVSFAEPGQADQVFVVVAP